jgi:cellulose synthase/poly-beta-1,6-N-acetylglucosamine synthase-like glycosyltransferase
MLELIYLGVCGLLLVIMLFLYGYSFHALWVARRYRPGAEECDGPEVALVIPCKGIDPNLEENLRRHFHHDYPAYRIVFTVASADDPSCPIIRKLIDTEKGPPASLVVASERLPDCVEKVSNQITAFQSLDPGVEVIVCADSDGLARDRYWLRALVASLGRCELASGFRWYIPGRPSFAGHLMAAWDSTWCLLHALGKTAWGGAMAFTRATYDRLRFEDGLRRAVTDDLVLQVYTHRSGGRTGFTPGAMMISEPAHRFGDFYRWAVRQSMNVRLVTFWIWFMGFYAATVYGCFTVLTLLLLVMPGPWLGRLLPAGALAVVALYFLGRGWMDYRLTRLFFPNHPAETARMRWTYYWANPLTDLLAPVVAYHSLFARTIRWRGVNYRVKDSRVVRV